MYAAILMMFLAAGLIGVAAILASAVLGPKRATSTTLSQYESGVPAPTGARERIPVHFYLVAMMFIVFDLETAFFFPLAVRFQAAPEFLFVNAVIFVLILAVGYVYILRKRVLDWR